MTIQPYAQLYNPIHNYAAYTYITIQPNTYNYTALYTSLYIYDFDMCIFPLDTKTIEPFRKFSTSSEVPQNHDDSPSTYSQALPP